ncbi:MAG: hypothetical protein KAY50_03790 [Chitinophagaceae bacterium]|nr:hypothetical protein [Chitinophagaceae bacterium]
MVQDGTSINDVLREGILFVAEITKAGRLLVKSSKEKAAIIHPAEITDNALRFIGNPSVITRNLKFLEVTAITTQN